MATSAPTPVNTGSTTVTVLGPPTKTPTALPPGPGTTGKIYVAPVPPGPPETAPPSVSYANDPGLGVQPDTTPVVPVQEAAVDATANAIVIGTGSRAVPNYIEVLANGEVIIQNATALNFTGNGVVATANGAVATITITSSPASTYGDANVSALLANFGANTILTSGNITGGYFVGNGAQLTGISSYGNSNVVTLLSGFGSNTVSTTGNITGGNILGGANVNATTLTGTTVSVSANVTGGNILTAGLISATGNITGGNVINSGISTVTGNITGGNILTAGLISATGNITGGNILGGANVNATTHTGTTVSVTANVTGGNILTAGLISATGNITGGNILGGANVNATTHTGTTVSVSGNITGANVNATANLSVTGSIIATNITGYGNIIFNQTLSTQGGSDMSLIPATGLVRSYGNLKGYFANTYDLGGTTTRWNNIYANVSDSITQTVTGNVTGGNILTGGLISATGNITGGNLTISGNTATITTANYSIGYLNIPQISLAANSTAALVDSGKHYYSTTSGNLQLTIPDNANVAFPVGTALSLVVQAAGNVLVVTQPSTTLYLGGNSTAGNRVVSAYGMATLMKVATNTWFINGTGVS